MQCVIAKSVRNYCKIIYYPKHSCSRKYDLTKHIKAVHRGDRDHTCPICKKEFSQEQHMKNHVAEVHEGKNHINALFVCSVLARKKPCKIILILNIKMETSHISVIFVLKHSQQNDIWPPIPKFTIEMDPLNWFSLNEFIVLLCNYFEKLWTEKIPICFS